MPPLFIAASVASDADSAPEKSIFSPDRAIACQVASEYCISVSTRPRRPPADAERRDPFGELRDTRLGDEEVHVVHLHRVHAIGLDQAAHDPVHPRRRLGQPAPVGHRDDGAETARERTAERRVVSDGPLPQVRRLDVALHVDARVRQVRQLVERDHRTGRVVDDPAVCLSRKGREYRIPNSKFLIPNSCKLLDQPEQRLLALRADDEVHDRRAEHRIGVLSRKVSAPDDRHMRQPRTYRAARLDGLPSAAALA